MNRFIVLGGILLPIWFVIGIWNLFWLICLTVEVVLWSEIYLVAIVFISACILLFLSMYDYAREKNVMFKGFLDIIYNTSDVWKFLGQVLTKSFMDLMNCMFYDRATYVNSSRLQLWILMTFFTTFSSILLLQGLNIIVFNALRPWYFVFCRPIQPIVIPTKKQVRDIIQKCLLSVERSIARSESLFITTRNGSEQGNTDSGGEPELSSISMLSEVLRCSICLEEYNQNAKLPKFLPCHHTFCLECICQLCNTAITTYGSDRSLRCPQCRSVSSVPSDNGSALSTNFYMVNLIEFKQRRIGNNTR